MSVGKISISREEQIPFLNPDGTIMQMANFRIWVSVEADNPTEATEEVDKLMEIERQKLAERIPLLVSKEKRIRFVLEKLKQFAPMQYEAVLNQAKSIK